jgi:hypothetical protein
MPGFMMGTIGKGYGITWHFSNSACRLDGAQQIIADAAVEADGTVEAAAIAAGLRLNGTAIELKFFRSMSQRRRVLKRMKTESVCKDQYCFGEV